MEYPLINTVRSIIINPNVVRGICMKKDSAKYIIRKNSK